MSAETRQASVKPLSVKTDLRLGLWLGLVLAFNHCTDKGRIFTAKGYLQIRADKGVHH